METNTIPILSNRNVSNNVIYDTYQEAISAINSRKIKGGELFFIAYRSLMPNYNIPDKRLDIILAYGIADNEYRILNFCTSNIIWGIFEDDIPSIDILIHDQRFLYHDRSSDRWFLVFSLDKVNRVIQEIEDKPQTFIDISTGNLWISSSDRKVRQLNDICTREEVVELLGNLEFSQKDWLESNPERAGYIKNKPKISDLGYITYTIKKDELTQRVDYDLYWTEYDSGTETNAGTIQLDIDKEIESGSLDTVTINNKQFLPANWKIGDKFLDIITNGEQSHVYVHLEPIINRYVSGNGVQVVDNIISSKVDENSGLSPTISWDLATPDTNGAMSSEDHRKLVDFDPEKYASKTKLESGEIVAKITSGTRDIMPPESTCILRKIDSPSSILTELEYIKEESLIEEIGVFPGSSNLFSVKLVCTGANQFNPTNKISGVKIDTNTKTVVEDSNYSLIWCPCTKSEINIDYNEPIYNNGYVISGANIRDVFSLNTPPSIGDTITSDPLTKTTTLFGSESYMILDKNQNLVFSVLTSELDTLCIRLAWDGQEAKTYEAYTESVLDLSEFNLSSFIIVSSKFINIDGTLYFSDILREIENAENLSWVPDNEYCVTSDINLNLEYEGDYLDVIYVTSNDEVLYCAYTQISVDEGELIYPMPTVAPGKLYVPKEPELINTGISSTFPINKYGIEYLDVKPRFQVSGDVIGYGHTVKQLLYPNLIEQLGNFRKDLSKKVGRSNIDLEVSDISENPISNRVIKQYVDNVSSAIRERDVMDLSRYDIFCIPNTGMTTANCYVICETGTFKFPLVYGNSMKNGIINRTSFLIDPLVEDQGSCRTYLVDYNGNSIVNPIIDQSIIKNPLIIWTEIESLISDLEIVRGEDCRYLQFKVNDIPVSGANAVIGIIDASDRIIWSWHIWVVSDIDELHPIKIKNNITNSTDIGSAEYDIMPLNLGYVKSGTTGTSVYYQWGRKDPFPRSSTIGPGRNTTVNLSGNRLFGTFGSVNDGSLEKTLENSIKNPNLFFTQYDNVGYHWLAHVLSVNGESITTPTNLWDLRKTSTSDGPNDNSLKTVYDPCPVGWKVPVRDVFRGITKTQYETENTNDFNVVGPFSSGWNFMKYYEDPLGLFYPTTGFRNESGEIIGVSDYGFYWSSSVKDDLGYCMNFSSSSLKPISGISMSWGTSIRPILE